jgi:3-hydroxybutyrate dehydrogenase
MLSGKTAIITGSTSGIGIGIARAFAREQANIMLNGFGERSVVDKILEELTKDFGVKVSYSGADVSSPEQVKDMVGQCIADLGSADILVNNAGVQHTAAVDAFPDEKWEQILATNLSAAFYGIKATLPYMRRSGWGRIVNIASAHGLVASSMKSAYVAAKHGLIGLTKVVALETARSPITCNAICPGWVLTPLVQKQIDDLAAREAISGEEAKRNLLAEKQPSLEFVTSEQIGSIAVFLCSPAADQMRGTSISVDGGWAAQ